MSDQFGEFDGDETDSNSLVKDLRKQIKANEDKVREAEARAAAAERSLAERNLKDTLATLNAPDHIAKWIVKDDVDLSDPDAVKQWVESNGADFGYVKDQGGDSQQAKQQPEQPQPEGQSDTDTSGYEAVEKVGDLSAPASKNKHEQAASELKADMTADEVYQFFKQRGL